MEYYYESAKTFQLAPATTPLAPPSGPKRVVQTYELLSYFCSTFARKHEILLTITHK